MLCFLDLILTIFSPQFRSLYHMHPKYVVPFLLDQDGNNIKLPGALVTA